MACRTRDAVVASPPGVAEHGELAGVVFLAAGQDQLESWGPKTDSVLEVVADAEGLALLPAPQQPWGGTYWEVHNSLPCLGAPLPCPPLDPTTPVYAIGGNHFLTDLMAGPLIPPLPSAYRNRALSTADYASIVAAQVAELRDFVAQVQASQSNGQMNVLAPPPVPGDDTGTNYWEGGSTLDGPPPGTNDLWLEILSMSVSNATASLVIHPPWSVTNGVYDLLYCTNLAPPISWQWLLCTDPGQTNLTVANVAGTQGFYRLALPNDLVATSSLGTNFWLAFPYMYYEYGPPNLSLYVSSPVVSTGSVSIPGLGFTQSFSGGPGAVATIAIPIEAMLTNYDVVETYGIHVTATRPVSVFALNNDPAASAAFNCFPAPMLGINYCVMARANSIGAGGCYSQFAIVATADNTTVSITPSPTANLDGHPDPYQVTNLMQGQTYQIGTSGGDYTSDVTGTWVASDKPIVLLAGASCAFVPDIYYATGNPLVQEQLSVDTWGTQVLALSFAGRQNGDTFRVLAATNNTVVSTNGVVAGTIQAGQFLEFTLDGSVEFRASSPIQVAQLANGWMFDGAPGDPCEILLPPAGRYLLTNTVFTPPNDYATPSIFTNYLNIIVPESALASTRVDGSAVAATNFVPIGTSGYCGAHLALTNEAEVATSHTVSSSEPIWVQVYGFGGYTDRDAYCYFGGLVK